MHANGQENASGQWAFYLTPKQREEVDLSAAVAEAVGNLEEYRHLYVDCYDRWSKGGGVNLPAEAHNFRSTQGRRPHSTRNQRAEQEGFATSQIASANRTAPPATASNESGAYAAYTRPAPFQVYGPTAYAASQNSHDVPSAQ